MKSGNAFCPRLNMGESLIVNKYREGKKKTLKEAQKVPEIVTREADEGQQYDPIRCRKVMRADRLGTWNNLDLECHLAPNSYTL